MFGVREANRKRTELFIQTTSDIKDFVGFCSHTVLQQILENTIPISM